MRAPKGLPSVEDLHRIFIYRDGVLIWKSRGESDFVATTKCSAERKAAIFNAAYAGKVAGFVNADGYVIVRIVGSNFKAHRIIYKMFTGEEPDEVDHEDHDRSNNKFENLRPADRSVNQRNASKRKSNTSGCMGVMWCTQREKWKAYIQADGKRKYLGASADKGEAIAMRKAAERAHGYGPNHGACDE